MTLGPIHIELGAQRKAHAIVHAAERLDLRFAARLLPCELIAGQAKDRETFVLVRLVELLKRRVLRCQAALGGHVDHQHYLPLYGFKDRSPPSSAFNFRS